MFLQSLRNTPIEDIPYAASWDGVTNVGASKNTIYDKIETLSTSISALVSDLVYDATNWNGVGTIAPSKNAVRDKIENLDASIPIQIAAKIIDDAYDKTTWDGATGNAPSRNAVRDKFESLAPNITGALVDDTAYNAGTWDGAVGTAPSKNAVRDKIESLASTLIFDTAYGPTWDGATGNTASRNAIYDKFESLFSMGAGALSTFNITNVSASSIAGNCYIALPGAVVCWGYLNIDPIAGTNVTVDVALPIASNLGAYTDLGGVAACDVLNGSLAIYGDSTNDRARFAGTPPSTAAITYTYIFAYRRL